MQGAYKIMTFIHSHTYKAVIHRQAFFEDKDDIPDAGLEMMKKNESVENILNTMLNMDNDKIDEYEWKH